MFKHRNLTSVNKILWVRGEIAPQEQFFPFPTIFSIYISNQRSLITYSFVEFGRAICIFLNSENLICQCTDESKCFRGSLQLLDNESRLYIQFSIVLMTDYPVPEIRRGSRDDSGIIIQIFSLKHILKPIIRAVSSTVLMRGHNMFSSNNLKKYP